MKNKKLFGICSLLFATGLILGACGTKTNSSSQTSETPTTSSSESGGSSSSSSSSSEAVEKFTVRFLVEGQVVQTSEVEKGQLAHYDGETPTKAGDAQADKYGFRKWDKDLNTPITANTDFNAVFAAYANHQVIGDFESYTESAELIDDGWTVLGYNNTTQKWEVSESASVALATRARNGNKSLRLNNWGNGVGHKIAKQYTTSPFSKAANALKFSFMTPSYNVLKVLLHFNAELTPGKITDVSFTYVINPISNEYVDYVIPFASEDWAAWGDKAKFGTLHTVAEDYGLHEDDLPTFISAVEFFVQGTDGKGGQPQASFLDSAEFITVDNPKEEVEQHFEQYARYTGTIPSGNVVRLDILDGENAKFSAIDLETPIEVPGKVSLDDATNTVSFVSGDQGATINYSGTLMNGGQFVKFKSASGTMASQIGELDLNAVQIVDNYEQYDKDGQAYYTGNTDKNARSGARGAYYSEYYSGSGSSEWGGSGWSLLGGDGSQLKLKSDGNGHNGSKNYLCLKHSNGAYMRYMQWGLFDGTAEQNSFRGSKFSFWAKTNGLVKQFKVYFFRQSAPTNQTKDSYVAAKTFEETAAVGSWKHYTIDIDPAYVYYGFMIGIDKLNPTYAESYLYIDDVEVYTADPYAQYVAPEVKSLSRGMHFLGKIGGLVTAQLAIGDSEAVSLAIPGFGVEVNGTYEIENDDVTMTLGSTVYKATIQKDYAGLTFKSATGGDFEQYLKNVSFDAIDFAETAESYENDGKMYYEGNLDESTISGARGAYYCDRYTGSGTTPVGGSGWALMGGSGDQIVLDKSDAVEGKQSVTFKRSNGAALRYLQWELYKGTAKERTGVNKFTFFLKNPAANEMHVKIYVFKVQQITPSTQQTRVEKEITMSASQGWTPYSIELNPSEKYYGYGIYTYKGDTNAFVKFDGAYFSSAENDPSLFFSAKNGLVLHGNITAGPATMTFGDNGAVTLNNANLGGDLAGTYKMQMNGANQEMVITTSIGTITGKYAVNKSGIVTFTVTAVTGDLAAGVNVNAVLANAD